MGIMAASPDAAMIMNICARSVPWTAVQGSAGMSMTAVLTVVMIMWTVIVTEPVMRSESVRYPAVRRAGIMSMTARVIAGMIMRAAIATEPATV